MEQTEHSSTPSRRTSATTRSSARSTSSGSASCGGRAAIGVLLVLVLLFSAWQHFELLRHGYQLEQMQRERAAEEEVNRHLRLEIETLRAPQRIEKLAHASSWAWSSPVPGDAVVIERVRPAPPPPAALGRRAPADDRREDLPWPTRPRPDWRPDGPAAALAVLAAVFALLDRRDRRRAWSTCR